MAREVKIKIKNENGNLEFKKVDFPAETEKQVLEETLKKAKFKFSKKGAQRKEIIREIREYELITPLFGGGATTKKADEVSIVRATEIRGHLRFWWRATRGGQFDSIKDLKKHEDAIFGSTEKYSALQIEVEKINVGSNFGKPSELGYAWFPLRDTDSVLLKNVSFKATFTYPSEIAGELNSAIWAWENFGGIGARTRRGFGALKLTKHILNGEIVPVAIFESETEFRKKAEFYVHGGKAPRGVPYLEKDLRLTVLSEKQMREILSAEEIWKVLIAAYKSFRQQRVKTGRSKWNEPEAIRNLINQRLMTTNAQGNLIEEETHESRKPDFEKFPRAAFGLPILFKFHSHDTWEKDKRILNKRDWNPDGADYDPRKTILNLTGFKRFSSPLILRPLTSKNEKAVGIALILENEQKIDEIGLTLESQEGTNWSRSNLKSSLTSTEAKEIKVATNTTKERLQSDYLLGDETDVLQAFLNYLEK